MSMTITDAQADLRQAYVGGGPGAVVSGLLWLVVAWVEANEGTRTAFITLFFGGMLIYPLGLAASRMVPPAERIIRQSNGADSAGKHDRDDWMSACGVADPAVAARPRVPDRGGRCRYALFRVQDRLRRPNLLATGGADHGCRGDANLPNGHNAWWPDPGDWADRDRIRGRADRSRAEGRQRSRGSIESLALPRLEAAIGLVDDVSPTVTANHPAIAMARLERLQ